MNTQHAVEMDKVGKTANRLGIGGNNPPDDAEALRQKLLLNYKDDLRRFEDLQAAIARLPEKCGDQETQQKLTSFGAQLMALRSVLENSRKKEKGFYDGLASICQGFFRDRISILEDGAEGVTRLLKVWKSAEDARLAEIERKRKDQEAVDAEIARKASQELADRAAQLESAGMTQAAEKTMQQAHAQERVSSSLAASASEPVQVKATMRGSIGGSAVPSDRLQVEVTNMAEVDLNLLRPYLKLDDVEKALRAHTAILKKQLKKGELPAPLKGVRFFYETNISFKQ